MHTRRHSASAFLALLLAGITTLSGTLRQAKAQDAAHDPAIPTPETFFGFNEGEWHVRHDRLLAYAHHLAELSDRIVVERYGTTIEQRPLDLVLVTHPDNHRRREELRTRHILLSDPQRSAEVDIAAAPAVLWMGFTVHGNEASGANAVPRILYQLAAARSGALDSRLKDLIILIDPCLNPDGYERFVTWVNGNRGAQAVADPNTREHNETWPGGRGNHYWFDLNRDYMPLVHPESQARMEQYYRWRPSLLLDFHEMGTSSTYFFQPGRPSAVHPRIPEKNRTLTRALAERFARSLDAIGSLYFTEEIFDDFFVGKGSTYTDLTGSVGILFEQASVRGHRQEHPNGILTFPFAIRNQVTSALTAIDAAADLRLELLEHQREFYRTAETEARRAPVQTYLVGSPTDPYRVALFAELLRRHRIVVRDLAAPHTANGITFVPASAFLVDAAQPQFRLLATLFEVRTEFQDSIFYDVSSWTLPYAYGLRFTGVRSIPDRVRGPEIPAGRFPTGGYAGTSTPLAYAFDWGQYSAPAVLTQLLDAGVLVRVAMQPFRAATGDRLHSSFAARPGTIVVPVGVQGAKADTIASLLRTAAERSGLFYAGISSGLTAEGIDIGSDRIRPVARPRVLIAAGDGVSSADAGEVWHLLDRTVGLEVSLAEPSRFGRIRLDRYTVLVLPGGGYSSIDSAGIAAVRTWVENGGTLVALENAIGWVVRKGLSPVSVRQVRHGAGGDALRISRPYGDMGSTESAQSISGAILAAEVDATHPLGFGTDSTMLPLCRTSTLIMQTPRDPYATPLRYTRNPLLSGYLPPTYADSLAQAPAVVVSRVKRGRIIHITDSAAFRGFWLGSQRLIINAVFLGALARTEEFRGEYEETSGF